MHHLTRTQFLPISLKEAWDFFATPANLNKVTPEEMNFKITSTLPDQMYPGLIITYIIKPFLNIPMRWVTEITHIEDQHYFVDEQRKGPYHIWHHEHRFEVTEGGVIMTDLLYYDIGKSIFGWLAGKLFVHRQVKKIFDYRYIVLENYFKPKS